MATIQDLLDLTQAVNSYPEPTLAKLADLTKALASSDAMLEGLARRVVPHLWRAADAAGFHGVAVELACVGADLSRELDRRGEARGAARKGVECVEVIRL